jgi:hypothetical protein
VIDGVVVLQHRGDAFNRAPTWTLAPAPVGTAGGDGAPEFDLTYASDIELLSDGRIVSLARIGSRLLLFAPDGRGERAIVRRGNGPGELFAPTGMSRANGDTLIVPDRANNRINWIVPDDGVVASRPMPTVPSAYVGRPAGALRNGALVTTTAGRIQQGNPDRVSRPTASVVIVSHDAVSARVVATVPDRELVVIPTRIRGRPGSESLLLRFSRAAHTVAWDTVIASGSGDGYRIDLRDGEGQIRSSLRVTIARRPVTRAMRDAALREALRRLEGPRSEALLDPAESKRVEEVTPAADSLPPYGEWFVSPNQTLWIVDAAAPNETRGSATAFRQDGAIIGRLTWNGKGTPVAFGNDRVVLRETDADGVVVLKVFRIQSGAR